MSPITGSKPPLRPWQIITLGIAGVGVLVAVPSLVHALDSNRQKPMATEAMAQAPSEAWVPPSVPKPKIDPIAFHPVMPAARQHTVATRHLPMPRTAGSAAASPLEFTHVIRHDTRMASNTQPVAAMRAGHAGGQTDALSERLQSTKLNGVSATRLPDPEMTIPQGTIIPCIQQTALDSSYPGLITAIVPQNIYGAGGHTVLIDAGSKVVGTMQKGIVNGLSREFVLWQQMTTPAPNFVRIGLDSPAAGALGRTGLDGDVNRHFWEKIKGALLLSTVDTGIQAAALGATNALASNRGGYGGSSINFYQFQNAGDQAVNTLLQSTIQIPDTLTRPQGASCSIFVARDLDFSSVYALRLKGRR